MSGDMIKTVLVVEDEPVCARSISLMLETHGYNALHAVTGETAIDYVNANDDIDLVLMDIDLGPGINGIQAAQKILEKRDLPLVFVSSHKEEQVLSKLESVFSYGYICKGAGDAVFMTTLKMAFRLFETRMREQQYKAELQHRNNYVTNIIDNMFDMVSLTDLAGNFSFVGRSHEMLGYQPDELQGRNVLDFVHPDDLFHVTEELRKGIASTDQRTLEYRYRCHDGSYVWLETVGKVLFDDEHQPESLLFCTRDVTARKNAAAALEESEKKYRDLADNVPAMISTFLPDSTLLYVNRNYAEYFNARVSDLQGKRFLDFMPDEAERETARQTYLSLTPERPRVTYEHRVIDGKSDICWQQWTDLAFFDEAGTIDHFLSIGQDITERRSAEETLKRQLEEKTVLIRENHHRIKNNLASVEGLLSLQTAHVESSEAKEALHEALGRVRNVRLLYDRLLLSSDQHSVDVRPYIHDLVQHIVRLYPEKSLVDLSLEVEDIRLESKTVFLLGLIITEVITNSLKHAFSDNQSGKISLLFAQNTTDLALEIKDNGRGLPAEKKQTESEGFGLRLIDMLAQQLGGKLQISSNPGAGYRLTFNAK